MAQEPYYWHYRCAMIGLLTRIDFMRVNDDTAEQVISGKLPVLKFPCRFCGQEHEGYLERSPFGNR
jgi:hypothetical protein